MLTFIYEPKTICKKSGVIASDVWRSVPWLIRSFMMLFMRSTADGCRSTLAAATTAEYDDANVYLHEDGKPQAVNKAALDDDACEALWKQSCEWTNVGEAL